eukprot:TRINITY_DN42243_c0_g1_i1.p1 TRINITY_DN42243_c0_g1~~TRINITY_DN42243_c0_g1_i1.p1  ORF type:complete len:104 (-),score=25.25 TRINITY_DN42243_c0_g1_i1:16-327(-)
MCIRDRVKRVSDGRMEPQYFACQQEQGAGTVRLWELGRLGWFEESPGQAYYTGEIEFGFTGSPDVVTVPVTAVSYTHLRAHETPEHLVCRLLLEKKKKHIASY